MFSFMDDLPPNILGVISEGKITHEDYSDRLIPRVEAMLAKGPIRALVVMRNDIGDYSLEAMWDDQKFGFKHWGDLSHIAIVTDHAWVRVMATLFAPLYPARMKLFGLDEVEAAKAWIVNAI